MLLHLVSNGYAPQRGLRMLTGEKHFIRVIVYKQHVYNNIFIMNTLGIRAMNLFTLWYEVRIYFDFHYFFTVYMMLFVNEFRLISEVNEILNMNLCFRLEALQ